MQADQFPMPEQFRMTRLQVFNWGTFSGLHEVPISERGFLIVGRSGAGKSTLLDAISALMVPPRWLDFNAAAREASRAGRDRNLASYLRGAWAAQSDTTSGETATQFLRTGTTWSAISLTFRNDQGQHVVLVQLFWLRGNSNANTDVKRLYLIFDRPFSLRDVHDFSTTNFDVRKLKQALPDAYIRDEFRPYGERFSRMLGIGSEMALRLLHKTQSAKNIGDLNAFLRDFMLDLPETFKVADRLVSEFGELNAAHQAVVTARRQVQVLGPARARHDQMEALHDKRIGLEQLVEGMHAYRETMRMALLNDAIAIQRVEAEGREARLQRQRAVLANREAAQLDLEQQRREAGGDQIEFLEMESTRLEGQRKERMRKRKQGVDACKVLDWEFAGSAEGFAELIGRARQEMTESPDGSAQHDPVIALDRDVRTTQARREALQQEIASLRRQPSNIEAPMLVLRKHLAAAIGVAESALPFVGELIEVKPDESAWRGVVERVLRGFALSILVDDSNYAAFSAYVNDNNLGRKLIYFRTGRSDQPPRPLRPNSMVAKLTITAGKFGAWLEADLRQRFDYECVDSIRAFRAAPDRAVTREGQVKHSRARHEKDDRSGIDDRKNWILGFDNREKLALFVRDDDELAQLERRQQAALDEALHKLAGRSRRLMQCQTLVNLEWQEIDVLPLADRINAISQQLRVLNEGNTTLQVLDARLQEQRELVRQARDLVDNETVAWRQSTDKITLLQQQLTRIEQDQGIAPLSATQQEGLAARFAPLQPIGLGDVDSADRTVTRGLTSDLNDLARELVDCEKFIEGQFSMFVNTWQAEAGGLDPKLAAATDFFGKLARLETDGLPAHEQRFFDLLQNQSHQNLAALSTYLSDARKGILSRMEMVNDSLRQVPFNRTPERTSFLEIQVKDRQLPEVRQFKQDVVSALSHAWNDDPEAAEARFIELRTLVTRLASQEPELRRWRDAVLDVRLHVEFVGREFDSEGAEVDVHDSGAGKSGGQRQKLATTVLAAALRYQLGGSENGVPLYAPVVLDEAFDKADNEFTALAMNIFANFGFQMIVATPLKSVMTLEPFIGGACFVDIRDRRVSGILMIEYDEEAKRLKLSEHAGTGAGNAATS